MPTLPTLPRPLAAALLTVLVSASLAGAAAAQTTGTPTSEGTPTAVGTPQVDAGPAFVIRPEDGADGDYVTVEAEAGTTTEVTVVIGNADDEPLTLRTYAAETVPIANGGFSLADEEAERTGVSTWIDYPAETYEFAPEEGVERTVTITIPEGTAPGQYIAGLALQTAEPLEVEGTTLFNQIIRKTIAVFIIVPGPESPEFTLGTPELITEGASSRIAVPVVNSGNVLVKPAGELTLTDTAGEVVLTAPIQMGSVYAGTTAPLSIVIGQPLPDGDYAVDVDLADEVTGAAAAVEGETIALSSEEDAPETFQIAGTVTLAPDPQEPVFALIDVVVTNSGEPIDQSELVLDVMRDGEPVETFTLVAPLALPQGDTPVSQRYIPLTGFEPGTWSFEVRLNVVDPSTDASTNVGALDDIPEIRVGE